MAQRRMFAKSVIEDDSHKWLQGVCHYYHDADYIGVEVREVIIDG